MTLGEILRKKRAAAAAAQNEVKAIENNNDTSKTENVNEIKETSAANENKIAENTNKPVGIQEKTEELIAKIKQEPSNVYEEVTADENVAEVEPEATTMPDEDPVVTEEPEVTAEPIAEEPIVENTEEPTVEEAIEKLVEVVAEEAPEKITEKTTEEVPPEEKPVEAPSEDKPAEEAPAPVEKHKRGRKAKAKAEPAEYEENTEKPKKSSKKAQVSQDDVEANFDAYESKTPYGEFASAMFNYFDQEERQKLENDYIEKLNKLNFAPDMFPGTLKELLAEANALETEYLPIYIQDKKMLSCLDAKYYGVIDNVCILNKDNGSNEDERKRNGVIALSKTTIGGKTYNLNNMLTCCRMRWDFSSSFMERLKRLKDYLIIMSSAIKSDVTVASFDNYDVKRAAKGE